jgi:hypothetical protein
LEQLRKLNLGIEQAHLSNTWLILMIEMKPNKLYFHAIFNSIQTHLHFFLFKRYHFGGLPMMAGGKVKEDLKTDFCKKSITFFWSQQTAKTIDV